MDTIKSFYYMFKQKKWYICLLIGSLLYIPMLTLAVILSGESLLANYSTEIILNIAYFFVSILTIIFIQGYYFYNTNFRINDTNEELAPWKNLKQISLTGLKYMAAGWLYAIPLIIILGATFLLYVTNMYELNGPYIPENSIYYPIAIKVCNKIALGISQIIPIAFVADLNFTSLFNIKKIFLIIKNNILGFCLYLAFTVCDLVLYYYLSKATSHYPYITIPISAFVFFYMLMVKSEILAQFVKGALKKL